jgi:hypothetical protein
MRRERGGKKVKNSKRKRKKMRRGRGGLEEEGEEQ